MEEVRIQIIIPTRNNIEKLDKTMESIYQQEFCRDNIYIIIKDFGSSDGTYEKALSYDSYHLGVYRSEETVNERQMIADIARISQYTRPEGKMFFQIVLYPGDILYPQCLKKCSDAMLEYQNIAPNMIICEADILKDDGSIIKQNSLFANDKIIDGKKEINHYIERGYCHQVFCFGTRLEINRYRASGEMNEQRWWNKCVRSNNEKNAIYLSEPLACVQEIIYEDELEEILLRWESIIAQMRFFESKYNKTMNMEFEKKAKENLSNYAVWRSFMQYIRFKGMKMIEDCLMISTIIDGKITQSRHYQVMKELLLSGDMESEIFLREYFKMNGYN